jgi:heat shock protein HtpX
VRGTLRTFVLFVVLTALFCAAGWFAASFGLVHGGVWSAIAIFGALAIVLNFAMFFGSHKFVLWTYRAKIVTPAEAPRLHAIVDRVAARAGLPKPTVAIIPLQVPNAFATGPSPNKAVVAATEGILNMLDDEELEGVLSHEMGHVRHRDTLIMAVVATVAGAITFAARMMFWNQLFGGGNRDRNANPLGLVIGIAFMILAPLAAIIVQLAISRRREFEADRAGAEISGKPMALASALQKMEDVAHRNPLSQRTANPSTASMFIVNPFAGGGFAAMFRTHPRTEERIRRLKEMAGRP